MKLKEMIHENNRLREELSAENREYYEEMLVYIRSSDIHQRKAEELLLEMLQHLLEAQREGRSAVHVFGDQPARYCQELLQQLPKPAWSERLHMLLVVAWGSVTAVFFVRGLSGLAALLFGRPSYEEASTVHLSSFLIQMLFFAVMIGLTGSFLKKTAFQKNIRKFSLRFGAYFTGLVVVSALAERYLSSHLPIFTIDPWISLLIFAVCAAGYKILFLRT